MEDSFSEFLNAVLISYNTPKTSRKQLCVRYFKLKEIRCQCRYECEKVINTHIKYTTHLSKTFTSLDDVKKTEVLKKLIDLGTVVLNKSTGITYKVPNFEGNFGIVCKKAFYGIFPASPMYEDILDMSEAPKMPKVNRLLPSDKANIKRHLRSFMTRFKSIESLKRARINKSKLYKEFLAKYPNSRGKVDFKSYVNIYRKEKSECHTRIKQQLLRNMQLDFRRNKWAEAADKLSVSSLKLN